MAKLHQMMRAVFDADGVVVSVGGRHVPEQLDYALAVCDSLLNDGSTKTKVNVLEADAGLGKSLGYLVPCLAYLSMHEGCDPIIISTYTRVLQRQLLSSDLLFAGQILAAIGIKMPKVAYRMGRGAFFSHRRCVRIVNRLLRQSSTLASQKIALREFLTRVECNIADTGLWVDYIEQYVTFPDGISVADICMLYGEDSDNAGFDKHVADSSDCQLLITNHASLVSHSLIDGFIKQASMVVIDEVHHVEKVMTQRLMHEMLVDEWPVDAKGMVFDGTARDISKLVTQVKEALTLVDQKDGGQREILLESHLKGYWLFGLLEPLTALHQFIKSALAVLEAKQERQGLSGQQTEQLARLRKDSIGLNWWLYGGEQFIRGVMFSKTGDGMRLCVIHNQGAMAFSGIVAGLSRHFIMTSATLTDQNSDLAVTSLPRTLGFKHASIQPTQQFILKDFGRMQFCLSHSEVPSATLFDKVSMTIRFSHIWLDYATRMISTAAATGRVLVLTFSFLETQLIGARLKQLGINVLVHAVGHKLSEYLHQWDVGDQTVFLTPSGWEGLNLGSGSNKLAHVVITRLPYAPRHDVLDQIVKERLLRLNVAYGTIANHLLARMQAEAIALLKQGIGRGVRAPDDSVTIWIADPRIRDKRAADGGIYRNAIPKRFLADFMQAEVFEGEPGWESMDNVII